MERRTGRLRVAAAGLLALAVAGCAPLRPHYEPIDLTHTFDRETIYWPTAPHEFVLDKWSEGQTEAGYFYAAFGFCTPEHGGTHVDAPYHFHREGATVDRIDLDRLVAPGVVVDVRAPCARDRDHAIAVADLAAHEREHGRIPTGAIVLLRTGWSERWPDREAYLGTARRGAEAVAELHFPGLSPEAAVWLAEERGVAAVGIDTASIDPGPSTDFLAHRELFGRGVPAFENVDLRPELPAVGFLVCALPMKIGGGTGAPLRIVALVPRRR